MKKIILILSLFIMILMVACDDATTTNSDENNNLSQDNSEENASNSEENTENNTPDVEIIDVTVDQLIEAYENNELKADADYKGKIVRVTGSFDRVTNEFGVSLHLDGSDEWAITQVSCEIDENNEVEIAKATELNKGDTVIVEGKVDSYLFNVNLKDCTIIK